MKATIEVEFEADELARLTVVSPTHDHKGSPQAGIGTVFCHRSDEWEPETLFAETSIDDLGDIFRLRIYLR